MIGREKEARETAADFLRLNPNFSVETVARIYKDPAGGQRLVDALRKAGLK